MADDNFAAFQEVRTTAAIAVDKALFEWALESAPDGMNIQQLRDLKDTMRGLMNGHMRQAYDVGLANEK